jgi:uncharacterized membrane protein YkoI
MKTKTIICSILGVALIVVGVTACASSQAKLMKEAKVSRADAEKTALLKVPKGTVKEGELEKEDGKLIWSLDITTPDSKDIIEVAVDAITGTVVSVEHETAADEAKEK